MIIQCVDSPCVFHLAKVPVRRSSGRQTKRVIPPLCVLLGQEEDPNQKRFLNLLMFDMEIIAMMPSPNIWSYLVLSSVQCPYLTLQVHRIAFESLEKR